MVSGSGGQPADAGVDFGTDTGRAGAGGGGRGGSGDSITYGSQSTSGGYRTELFKLALMNGKQITLVGRDVRNSPDTVNAPTGWALS